MSTSSIPSEAETVQSNVYLEKKAHPTGYFMYCELLKIVRNPAAVTFGIGFPTLFFLLFANVFDPKFGPSILAQYAAYGAFVAAFQTFSISIANERSLGWNKLLRTTPMTAVLYLSSKFIVILLTGILSLLLLFAVAAITGRVQMDLIMWVKLFGFMFLGMFPFALLGIFVGFLGTPNLTQSFSTILTLVLSFASGLFLPVQFLPDFIRSIANYLPTYHLAQIAWQAVGATASIDSQPLWQHWTVLGGFALIFAILALWAYIRDENKNFA